MKKHLPIKKLHFLFYLFLCCSTGLFAQLVKVSGTVMDETNETLPYVNVYVEGTGRGTTTNVDGIYTIQMEKGQTLVFQYIGYEKQRKKIDKAYSSLNIQLKEQQLNLPQVDLVAGEKDPAYAIIEAAMDKRKYHLEEVESYSGDLYIKGVASFDEMPEKLPFFIQVEERPDSTDLGIIYLSESITRFHYQRPDNFKEEMIASKVSGMDQITSFNRAELILFNFYENGVEFDGLSKRDFISPIASSAMFYYRYKLLGSFYQDGKLVYKIKVMPKRKNDPCFQGELYIVDESWRIHSLDLFLTRDTPVEFVDTLRLEQSFAPIKDDIWMPISLKIDEHFKLFGFGIGAQFTGVFSKYQIDPAFDKKFFGNEVFTVTDEASKKDSLFWEKSRPVLLTKAESKDYVKGDSLKLVRESDVYKDSLDRRRNKVRPMDILMGGGSYRKLKKRYRIGYGGIVDGLAFNPVEGWNINNTLQFTKWQDEKIGHRLFTFQTHLGYGFSDLRWKVSADAFYKPDARKTEVFYLSGGSKLSQFNKDKPVGTMINTAYALLNKENYMKLYKQDYLGVGYQKELVNGLYVRGKLSYETRTPVFNNTEQSWSKVEEPYTPNNPMEFEQHNAMKVSVGAVYRHKQKYETTSQGKQVIGSDYPAVYFQYTKGINAIGSDVDYDFLKFGISDDIKLGLLGKTAYHVAYGDFLNDSKLYFPDFKHFNGNETDLLRDTGEGSLFDAGLLQYFHTLPYYDYSTASAYTEAHIEHHFNGFLINKIPLLRKTKFRTIAGANILNVEGKEAFTELFFGVENILKVLRIDFASSYTKGEKWQPQVRFGLSLGL